MSSVENIASAVRVCRCRLCDGVLEKRFSLPVLSKYNVTFSVCQRCESLQSETPYWLEEAYENSNLSYLDTGVVQRNLNNLGAVWIVAHLLSARQIYDVGGGDGLLCRMLRDYGLDCYISDRFARNAYAQGYEQATPTPGSMITAFEVAEHYGNPRKDLAELLGRDARTVLISTGLYTGQGRDWWYLTPESGQHVFFYSRKALAMAASQYGYDVAFMGSFILFTRGVSRFRRGLARLLLHPLAVRLWRILVVALPARGAERDFDHGRGTA